MIHISTTFRLAFIGTSLLALLFTPSISAQEQKWDAGFRLKVIGGSGKPTNDVLGYGVFGRYHSNDKWAVGFGIDQSDEFDGEWAAEIVGLSQDPSVEDIDKVQNGIVTNR